MADGATLADGDGVAEGVMLGAADGEGAVVADADAEGDGDADADREAEGDADGEAERDGDGDGDGGGGGGGTLPKLAVAADEDPTALMATTVIAFT